jgi:hypothetical protein
MVASYYTKTRMKLYDWIPEDKLDWWYLSRNPNAITMIETALLQDPYKINWYYLSKNPQAIQMLAANPDKIDWGFLSQNSSIFEIDTKQMKIELTKRAKNIDFYL